MAIEKLDLHVLTMVMFHRQAREASTVASPPPGSVRPLLGRCGTAATECWRRPGRMRETRRGWWIFHGKFHGKFVEW